MPACAANSVGLSISVASQIAKFGARADFHRLDRAHSAPMSHIAGMETDKNGGPNHLRAWRLHAGLTLEQLAAEVGTSPGMISGLENGDRGLSLKWLRRLAPLLNTTPGNLADYHPSEAPAEVIDIWTHISDRDQRRALAILDTFREKEEGRRG